MSFINVLSNKITNQSDVALDYNKCTNNNKMFTQEERKTINKLCKLKGN